MKDNQKELMTQEVLQQISEQLLNTEFGGLNGLIQTVLNRMMIEERNAFLEASPYERSSSRTGHSNGFKNLNLKLPSGLIPVNIPQVRNTKEHFYPEVIESIQRSEKAFRSVIAEMYIQGVSTRKVNQIIKQIWPNGVSSSTVSNMTKSIKEEVDSFRNRKLTDTYEFIWFDAIYEKVRLDGYVQDMAVLVAMGVNSEGKREIIGLDVEVSEAAIHWRTFFESLTQRGLKGVKLIISDAHAGLKEARKGVFPSIPWQRCYFHFSQNAQHLATSQNQKKEISMDVKTIFSQENLEDTEAKLKEIVARWEKKNAKFSKWLEENTPECFSYFKFEKECWSKIRTSNVLERLNKEIRRRTRVVGIFPDTSSCLRLIGSILIEKNEDWMPRTYIKKLTK
jgi:transposase-like protein